MFNIGAFISYVFVVTFTPGPNNILSMVNASKYGIRRNFYFISGVFVGFVIIIFLSGYFNLLLYNVIPNLRRYMSFVGAGYMFYLAIKIFRSRNDKNIDSKDISNKHFFTQGLMMQFVNPKVIIYGITVTSNFILPFYSSYISLFIFSLVLASSSFTSCFSWGLFGQVFNKFLSTYNLFLNILMSILLIYSALSIL